MLAKLSGEVFPSCGSQLWAAATPLEISRNFRNFIVVIKFLRECTSGIPAQEEVLLSITPECLCVIFPSDPLGGADKARPKKKHNLFIIAASSQQRLTDGKHCRIKMLWLGDKLVAFHLMT